MRKYIALALCAIIISTGNFGIISLANTIEQNSPDIYEQELTESIDIEGVIYIL